MAMAQPKPNDALILRLSRSFAAPRDRVFRAFTAPAQLAKWWGPKGFTVPACTMDVRAGGTWHTVMRSPEGKDHIVSGVYREMADVTIYGVPQSTYTRTCCMTIGYERKDAAPHSPDILAYNSTGKIPGFRHGDLVLWETSAITRYLDETFGGTRLQPEDRSRGPG